MPQPTRRQPRLTPALLVIGSVLHLGSPLAFAATSDSTSAAPTSPATPTSGTGIVDPPGMPADAALDTVVGKIQGKPITMGDLRNFAAARLRQQQVAYETRRQQLDLEYRRAQQQTLEEELKRSLTQQALGLEATAHKTNVLKLTGEVKIPAVTQTEARARYESRKVENSPPFEQVATEIFKGLQEEKTAQTMEAYYATLRTKYHADADIQPLRQEVDTSGPAVGPANAAITIVEFADFQCPYCRRMQPTLKNVLAKYSQKVRLVYKEYPLVSIHPQALPASQAAVCAERQGKFWEMHDAIFTDTAPLNASSLRAIAGRIGLDSDAFEKCVRDPEVNKAINVDVHAAEALGVQATPTLFVNGRFLQGGVPEEEIVALIEDELKHVPSAVNTKTAAR